MERFDIVVIGAGPAGEAAGFKARELGASVAVIDRDLFGGSCPHWGCVPSKTLLHGAARRAAGADHPWQRLSDRRDFMINRVGRDYPDDSSHVEALEEVGAVTVRGRARIDGPGRVVVERAGGGRVAGEGVVRGPGAGARRELAAGAIVVAVGSRSVVPRVEGLAGARTWTNREATGTRVLPRSLLVLGGGPTGIELAQVFARFGVPVTVVHSRDRLLNHDHPRNSAAALAAVRRDGVEVRLGVRAARARPGEGADGADVLDLGDGSSAEGHVILLSAGRTFDVADLGLESVGLDVSRPDGLPRDGRLRVADGVFLAGDVAGPELHTHQAHYQGELAVRMALGEDVTPDYRALPRATYTDPELAFVGLSLEAARAAGHDAFERVADFAASARGFALEAELGHVTIVVDRASRQLLGAAMAAPDASAAIHECVLAIRARVTLDVLADTIHAFPSTSRILNGLFADALRELG
jgi:pyruvate/2-oxoglutarate dehydrogenase complex dihydrolipoamide dehydrogenase (E3) component